MKTGLICLAFICGIFATQLTAQDCQNGQCNLQQLPKKAVVVSIAPAAKVVKSQPIRKVLRFRPLRRLFGR